jgi:hypothetical protein
MSQNQNYALSLLESEERNILDKLIYLDILELKGKTFNENVRSLYRQQLENVQEAIKVLQKHKIYNSTFTYQLNKEKVANG